MTHKHTVGPWQVWQRRTPAGMLTGRMPEITGKDGLPVIADIRWNGVNERDGMANAYLIAAAPELLDMLYTVLPYIETAEEDRGYKPGAVNTVSRQILAIIAKAEGRQ